MSQAIKIDKIEVNAEIDESLMAFPAAPATAAPMDEKAPTSAPTTAPMEKKAPTTAPSGNN